MSRSSQVGQFNVCCSRQISVVDMRSITYSWINKLPGRLALGEHIRKRRLELRLNQQQAAKRLGWSWRTVFDWENGKSRPAVESVPAIIGFLGYDPFPEAARLSDRLAAVRRANGWPIKQAAAQLGVDEGTWGRWEKTGIPWKRHQAIVQTFLKELCRGRVGH